MARMIFILMFFFAAAAEAGPYYFITVRNGAEQPEQAHKVLKEMVKLADAQHVKLTLLFSAQYAEYLSSDTTRMIELENWRSAGHEIGAYHKGPDRKDWDGYTDLDAEALARVRKSEAAPVPAPGHRDYFAALSRIAPKLNTGCMLDKSDKKFLAAAPAYETCLAPANGLKTATDSGSDGINDFIAPAPGRGEGKKRLSFAEPFDRAGMEAAKKAFSGMTAGVYGAAFNSSTSDFGAFFAWLKFLKGRDPQGIYSRTVSGAVENKILPERSKAGAGTAGGPAKAAVKKAAPEPPAVKKTEIPKLQKISNPYSQVERMLFGPARGAQQAQPRGGRQPRGQ